METYILRLSAYALFTAVAAAVHADPVAELASFSAFDKVDLAQLASGDTKSVRGPAMGTPRYIAVETCWVAPGAPAQQAAALRSWNPASHSELKVYLHTNGSNFSRLAQAPSNPAVQTLAAATISKSPALQISRDEAAKLPPGGEGFTGPVATFWSNVLTARAAAGPFAQPPYDHTGQAIRAGDEINGLLKQQGKIQKQFSGLVSGKGEQYWELIDVDNKGVLTLGASYNRQAAGGSYQAADLLYYASGGYYAAVTLYQLWPVDVGGKASTLVWRGDIISSAEVGDLRGVERLGAESALIKDVSRAVRLFRRDTGGVH